MNKATGAGTRIEFNIKRSIRVETGNPIPGYTTINSETSADKNFIIRLNRDGFNPAI